ncbi:sensor histidine kinase [Paenibacillus sacheonensis]|uniref:HAMP domain-containing protein n=1 Tax=Paenibacillus sacheonensis TaxID=742054 RepID=A0A7X4YQB0_9BACL|nr:histidine kinase [Paenibacillus sacheonensis]MBM7565360.1 two-component system sensor histidine kinase YesM [Paenibacillus sacheonensis]NBC69711.1 HAMP domain-containing protein [Paenibacillus sacheonensis]
MKQERRLKLSIYSKIVFVFLLVIVPICTMSLVINQKGMKSVKGELSKQLEVGVQNFMETFANELASMSKHQQEFILDKDLMNISFGGTMIKPYEMSQRMLYIEEKLGMIQDSSTLIRNVSAYIPILDRDISTLGNVSTLPAEEYDMVMKAARSSASKVVEWQGRLFIVLPYPSLALYDLDPSYALSIELGVDTLKQELSQFTKYGNGGYVLWNDEQSWSVTSEQDSQLVDAIQASLRTKHNGHTLSGVYPYRYNKTDYIVVHQYVPGSDMTLAVYVPEEEVLGQLSVYGNWFWIISILSVFVILFFSAWIYRQIHRPMSQLVRSLRKVENGVLEKMPVTRRADEFSYLYTQFNSMVDQLNVLIHQVYEQRIRSQSSELKQLQSQINPHFLYNTYFTLYRLAKIHDIDKVILFCEYLGNYFQYITRTGAESVSIEMELQHSRAYTDIQGIRFSERIAVSFNEFPAEMAELKVPQLFLQPILENAYNHGLENMLSAGKINVTLKSTELFHQIIVEDNGQELSEEVIEELRNKLRYRGDALETTGLINVHRRIQLFYGNGSGIELKRSELGGLQVTVHISRSAV